MTNKDEWIREHGFDSYTFDAFEALFDDYQELEQENQRLRDAYLLREADANARFDIIIKIESLVGDLYSARGEDGITGRICQKILEAIGKEAPNL